MSDEFSNRASGLSSPAADAVAIVPDDVTDLTSPARAVYVGASGALRVTMVSGATVDFASVAAGSILPIRVRRVMANGTSASGLVALR